MATTRRTPMPQARRSSASPAGTPLASTSSARVRWHHILLLGGLTAFGPLSTDMYLPALPTVSHELGATMPATQLTLTATILGLSVGQLIAGPLSDAVGRRRPLVGGLVLYLLSSLLCSVAPSVGVLTVLRAVQGVAGAAGIVIALAIARDLYAGPALARCISLLMMISFLAPLVAPLLGGQLLAVTSWHGIFVVLALSSAVALLAVTLSLPETLDESRRAPGGLRTVRSTVRTVLRQRRFLAYTLACSFAFAAGIIYISASSFLFAHLYHLSSQRISYIFGLNALGLVLMAQMGARAVSRVGPSRLLTVGCLLMSWAGLALLAAAASRVGLIGLLPPLFVLVASLGLIEPQATTLALAEVPPPMAGSAAALLGVVQLALGAVVAPLVGLFGTGSALPLTAAMAGCSMAALGTCLTIGRPARAT